MAKRMKCFNNRPSQITMCEIRGCPIILISAHVHFTELA